MNTAFSNNLLYLRKERGISQKQAADELGISQSLLSHYEKGIRECGLEFLVKAADYYNVTCDYLLGRTAQRSAKNELLQKAAEPPRRASENPNRQVIVNNIDFIYTLLSKIRDRDITRLTSEILMTDLYAVFRILYRINPQNDEHIFMLSKASYQNYVTSHREYKNAKLIEAVEKVSKSRIIEHKPPLSYEIIMRDYKSFAGAVLNLIHGIEKSLGHL